MATLTGKRIVEMVWEDLKPRDFLSKESFDNAIVTLMAMGGSTNALIHLVAMAGRAGIKLPLERFDEFSAKTPLLANVRPSGDKYLMEDFYYAGGLRALLAELKDLLHARLQDRQRQDARREPRRRAHLQRRRDPDAQEPAQGIRRPGGAARQPRAQRRGDQGAAATEDCCKHTGKAVVFDDYNDMAARIDRDDLDVDADSVLVLRNAGPLGGPGMPEWGMLPMPKKLLQAGRARHGAHLRRAHERHELRQPACCTSRPSRSSAGRSRWCRTAT